MSRTDPRKEIIEYPLPTYNSDPKIHLIDGDSLTYRANAGYEHDLDYAKFRIDEEIRDILTNVESCFNIVQTLIFIKGEDNFRYSIDAAYKSNRPPKHPHINLLYDHIKEKYENVIMADGAEADDYIYTAWKMADGQVVISSNDKDIRSFCYGDYYRYDRKQFITVTEQETIYNRRIQLLIGDTGDGVNYTPGYGESRAKKAVKIDSSEFTFKRELIRIYKKFHGENYKKVVKDVYNLLCLHHVENLNTLNIEYGRN